MPTERFQRRDISVTISRSVEFENSKSTDVSRQDFSAVSRRSRQAASGWGGAAGSARDPVAGSLQRIPRRFDAGGEAGRAAGSGPGRAAGVSEGVAAAASPDGAGGSAVSPRLSIQPARQASTPAAASAAGTFRDGDDTGTWAGILLMSLLLAMWDLETG